MYYIIVHSEADWTEHNKQTSIPHKNKEMEKQNIME